MTSTALAWLRLTALTGLATLSVCAGPGSSRRADAPRPIAITNVTVIPMTDAAPATDQTVLIEGDRITLIGPTAATTFPAGAQVVDGTGKFVIPGLWDMHVHTSREGRAKYFWPLFLAHGVTGVREMGSYLDTLMMWRSEHARRPDSAPRVVWSSPMLDGSPASWKHGIPLASPEEARRMVDSMRALGFDFVKVYERLPRDVYLAIAEEAKRIGMPFAGHVPSAIGPVDASEAGQGTLEHEIGLTIACVPGARELLDSLIQAERADSPAAAQLEQRLVRLVMTGFDQATCDRIVAVLAKNRTRVVPTFVVQRGFTFPGDSAMRNDPRRDLVPPALAERWEIGAAEAVARQSPEERAFREELYRRYVRMVGAMHEAGVPILAGTDASDEAYVYAGSSLHDELELLVAAGLTPREALAAATVAPAEYLGALDSLGTIEPGRIADLVVLDANPLVDIRNTRRIHAVVRAGRLYGPPELAGLLALGRREAAKATPSPPAYQP